MGLFGGSGDDFPGVRVHSLDPRALVYQEEQAAKGSSGTILTSLERSCASQDEPG